MKKTKKEAKSATCGAVLDFLEKNFEGIRLIAPENRAQLRAGRGRRSNRR